MIDLTANPHLGKTAPGAWKTPSGSPGWNPDKRAYRIDPEALKSCRKARPAATTTASGVSVYGFRYYEPEMGRWLGRDPIGIRGGSNLYGFIQNRTGNGVDALGLQDSKVYGGKIGAISEEYTWKQTRTNGTKFTPTARTNFEIDYEVTRDGCRINVNIPINLQPGATPKTLFEKIPGYQPATADEIQAIFAEFQKGVDEVWSDKYRICCDKISASSNGQVNVFTNPKHCCCTIKVNLVQSPKGERIGIFKLPVDYSNQFNWNLTNPNFSPGKTASHEVGHSLGNIDRYGESLDPHMKGRPESDQYGPTLDSSEAAASVMGENLESGVAHASAYWRIFEAFDRDARTEGCRLEQIK